MMIITNRNCILQSVNIWRRSARSAGLLSCIVFLIVVLSGCTKSGKENEAKLQLGDVELETLDGEPIDWLPYKGKIVFINFWATWCRPCLEEMPSIERVKQDLDGSNVVFLFASDEDPEQILAFSKRRNFDFTYVRTLNLVALDIQALPTTFIFNEEGELTFSEAGYRDWSLPENKRLIKP